MNSLGTLTRSTQKKEISTQKYYDNNLQKENSYEKMFCTFLKEPITWLIYMIHPKKRKFPQKNSYAYSHQKAIFQTKKFFTSF